jgi:hypothetical protein
MTTTTTASRLRGRPERVFVSVDESTGKSTISFHPADVGTPVQRDDDRTGAAALAEAKSISAKFPGCTVHGPHFHAARQPGARGRMRRPPQSQSGGGGGGGGGSERDDD